MNIEKVAELSIWKILQATNIEFSVSIGGLERNPSDLNFNLYQSQLLRDHFHDFLIGVYGPVSATITPREREIRESILQLAIGEAPRGIQTASYTLEFTYPDGRPSSHYHVSLLRDAGRLLITALYVNNVSLYEMATKQYDNL